MSLAAMLKHEYIFMYISNTRMLPASLVTHNHCELWCHLCGQLNICLCFSFVSVQQLFPRSFLDCVLLRFI